MRRHVLVLLLFLAMILSLARGDSLIIRTLRGTELELSAVAFAPGQIIMISLVAAPEVKKVAIRFRGHEYELGPKEEGRESFALIGLDLALEPGPQNLRLTVLRLDGQFEALEKEILLARREFPVKKLWVKEEYVIPPPEVQERIAREAEILDLVYSTPSGPWLGAGRFILPHAGEMASNFGERRIYNNIPRSSHSGVDISAPHGSPV
ncbi:MAG: hypothetical protein AB1715_06290, partial [Acidobacteriota bacterium]